MKVGDELIDMKVEEAAVVVQENLEVERVERFWQGLIMHNYKYQVRTRDIEHTVSRLDLVFERELEEKQMERMRDVTVMAE